MKSLKVRPPPPWCFPAAVSLLLTNQKPTPGFSEYKPLKMLEIYATKGHAAGRARALKVELSRQVRGRPDRPNPRRSRDDTGLAPKNRPFRLTEQRFLPRN